ncbi:22749_t:CDS:2, partial [Racocetra persica]
IEMSANARYLGLVQKCGNCQKFIENKTDSCQCEPEQQQFQFVLPYKLYLNFAPAVKCEVSTEATFEDYENPLRYMSYVKVKGSILAVAGEIDFHLEQLNNREKTHIGEAPTEQEAQTERMFKSTFRQFLDKTNNKAKLAANGLSVQWHKYGNFGTKQGEKFEQPDFKYEKAPNYLELGSNAWDITEAEIIEIEEHYEGQENTGGDTVIPASTSVFIKKISRVENEATGINYLEQAIKALPSDALKKSA